MLGAGSGCSSPSASRTSVWVADSGIVGFGNATVRWFLSVNSKHLPDAIREKGQRTYRSITFDGEEVEFSEGFTDLHTESYRDILGGGGFGLDDALPSIDLVHAIREAPKLGLTDDAHPFASKALGS